MRVVGGAAMPGKKSAVREESAFGALPHRTSFARQFREIQMRRGLRFFISIRNSCVLYSLLLFPGCNSPRIPHNLLLSSQLPINRRSVLFS